MGQTLKVYLWTNVKNVIVQGVPAVILYTVMENVHAHLDTSSKGGAKLALTVQQEKSVNDVKLGGNLKE